MKRKRTLRRLPPTTRQGYRILGEIQSATKRLERLLEMMQTYEMEWIAVEVQRRARKLKAATGDLTPAAGYQVGDLGLDDQSDRPEIGSNLPLEGDPGPVPDEVG